MELTTLKFEIKNGHTALIKLNRPNQFNAISKEMTDEFEQVFKEISNNENIRVIIISGEGKPFSAGGDLAWLMVADDNLKKRDIVERAGNLILTVSRCEIPVIAAVNGVAAGAGTAIAMCCDLIIASDKARFAPNFVNIGAVPDSGASWFLPRMIGYHKAAELMLTGKLLSAQEALDLGIFNQVVPHEKLEETVLALAQKLANGPQLAIKHIKKMLKMSQSNTLESQIELENSLQLIAWSDPDFAEGVTAFMEKRKPNFK